MFTILKYLISEDIKCKSITRTVAFVVDSEEWCKYDKLPYASTRGKEVTRHNFLVSILSSLGEVDWNRFESCFCFPEYLAIELCCHSGKHDALSPREICCLLNQTNMLPSSHGIKEKKHL